MSEVAKVHTPQTAESVASQLSQAWQAEIGGAVPPAVLALMLALSDLETATFGSGFFNHNYGNIIATSEGQPFYRGIDSGNKRKFRAYGSAADGARGFVKQLTRDSRKQWREGLLTGDPEEFVRSLNGQRGGPSYFEAGFDHYLKTFMGRWQRYRVPEVETPDPKASPPKAGGLLVAGLLGLGAWAIWKRKS